MGATRHAVHGALKFLTAPPSQGGTATTTSSALTVGTRPTSRPRLRASFRQRRSWGIDRMMGTWRGACVVPDETVEWRREHVERSVRATGAIGGDMVGVDGRRMMR